MLFSVSHLVALFFFLDYWTCISICAAFWCREITNLLKDKLWDMALDQSAQGTTTLLALVVL